MPPPGRTPTTDKLRHINRRRDTGNDLSGEISPICPSHRATEAPGAARDLVRVHSGAAREHQWRREQDAKQQDLARRHGFNFASITAVKLALLFNPASVLTSPANFPTRPNLSARTRMTRTSPGTAGARNFAS